VKRCENSEFTTEVARHVLWRNSRHTEECRYHSRWSLTVEDTWHSALSRCPCWTLSLHHCCACVHSTLPGDTWRSTTASYVNVQDVPMFLTHAHLRWHLNNMVLPHLKHKNYIRCCLTGIKLSTR